MSKLSAILFLVLFYSVNAYAQPISVSGAVEDTLNKKGIQNAVVALLSAKDSVLYKFARTDVNGKYSIKNLKPGEYLLMATHPYFADVIFNLGLKDVETAIPGIALTSKSKLLEEVIVKTGSPIKIKGDTTVYTADSFKVRAGANVEELLRKLPGITVDKDGKITAMGEQVKKVLVDGEEFFGDDPGIATKNLRADIVKEVEVFDKKSDQAAFTGIDDGVKDKTINLKLKDNAKKGYFGKAEAGTDFKNYYNNSIMANAFKGKRKLAAYGIMSNTGKTNLDWDDQNNYGGGMGDNMVMQDNGDVYFMGGGGEDNYYGGRGGIPQNWNGGFHYSNKFNNGKHSLNSGYKITKVNSPSGERNFATNFTGDSSYNSNSVADGFSTKIKHSLNLSFETNIDSSNSLKFTARGNFNNTRTSSNYSLTSISDKALLINTINRQTSGTTDNSAFNTSLLWKHKFKKLARTITVNVAYNISGTKSDSYLNSRNEYYKGGVLNYNDTTDLENVRDNNTSSLSTNITYTEPLAKDLFLSFNYAFTHTNNVNERTSYSKDLNNKYNVRIDSLTNSYLFKQVNHKPGISFRMVKKKYNYSIGVAVSNTSFKQDNRTQNLLRKYSFTNFFPSASVYKKLSGNGGIRFNYNGSSKAPTLDQLQPIVDNTDQVNQYIGNPDLKQSFTHNVNVNYNFYNVLQEKGMWVGIYGNVVQNAFVNERTLDDVAKSKSRTVNANGNYYLNLYSNYNFKIKKPNIRISFGPSVNVSRNISFLKTAPLYVTQKSINTNSSYGLRFGLSKEKEKKYDISFNSEITRVNSKSSINNGALANYWQGSLSTDIEITLPFKFRFETDLSYKTKQKDPRFPAKNTFTLWNASLTRNLLKDKLEAGISVNDILNENRGYDRSFSDNRYSETYYNTLKRFWMLTLTWNFSKNGKPTSDF
jgi:Outer membrane protein beta-barrel family/Carboxypeptidase regulatory-like domain